MKYHLEVDAHIDNLACLKNILDHISS